MSIVIYAGTAALLGATLGVTLLVDSLELLLLIMEPRERVPTVSVDILVTNSDPSPPDI